MNTQTNRKTIMKRFSWKEVVSEFTKLGKLITSHVIIEVIKEGYNSSTSLLLEHFDTPVKTN